MHWCPRSLPGCHSKSTSLLENDNSKKISGWLDNLFVDFVLATPNAAETTITTKASTSSTKTPTTIKSTTSSSGNKI